ncbi:MAG TPA: heavy metal-associated domain-containing protein [Fimbriimonadaceae bacterium]|nr:heavy metal-associated domain-containing protein [Fimbriimonadaceae bacterium]
MKLKIEGMTCQNCVRHVTEALQRLPGATNVAVDLQAGSAVVEGVTIADAIAAVEEEGYEARAAD